MAMSSITRNFIVESEEQVVLAQKAQDARLERLKEGSRIVEELREEARRAGIEEMSMDEIDAIITECRQQMREDQGSVHVMREGYKFTGNQICKLK